ncbi:MAG: type II toxin-antitoxin system RelE/ParE family toxin [Acidobacteriota bacterium]
MTIILSPLAREDLSQAYDWIAQDSVARAEGLLARIFDVLGLLASGALMGREVRLQDGRRMRTWPAPPYRIYYVEGIETLRVLRVYHQARRPIEE